MDFQSMFVYNALHPYFQERVHRHEPLADYSSFGVGGPADLWLWVETRQELSDLISLCAQQRWPLLVVGAGSNILYSDAGVRGIVASVSLCNYHIEEQADKSALIIAESGVRWAELLKDLVPLGWGGLEFAVGIPGTLGAGAISNVGAHNKELGQAVEWIEVLDARACNRPEEEPPVFPVVAFRRYQHDDLDLGYRHSRFRENRLTHITPQGQLILPPRGLIEPAELVVTLGLRVHRQDPAILENLLKQNIQERKKADPGHRHRGSVFKDPPGTTARALIERAGLAGKIRGNAQISEQNPNYIVNLNRATATDVATLIIEAHQQVLARTGVNLALNVELLGEWQPYADTLTVS
jgi:UDP-N-acetylmuramate dehydrogenase